MIVLDTHAWLWWISSPEKLGPAAATAIEHAMTGNGILLSSISTGEIALLVRKGRLVLSLDMRIRG
ncbi:MAG: hypothetical protein ACL93V_07940 [Candidatus Electrothrix sp. YB6]